MPDPDEVVEEGGTKAVIPTDEEGDVEDLPAAGEEPVPTTTVEDDPGSGGVAGDIIPGSGT